MLRAEGEDGKQVAVLMQVHEMHSFVTEESLGRFSVDSTVQCLLRHSTMRATTILLS